MKLRSSRRHGVAALALALVEDGVLGLEDDVTTHLPARFERRAAGRPHGRRDADQRCRLGSPERSNLGSFVPPP